MPQFHRIQLQPHTRIWGGKCPVPGCPRRFTIEADPDQPKGDVLKAFKAVRPKSKHAHGVFRIFHYKEYAPHS
ncbi:MAG: hypothetical protein HYX97_04350 [Chloroflexi bacterium]|nr:hypothetical protein [Chloroflexota bacterium]